MLTTTTIIAATPEPDATSIRVGLRNPINRTVLATSLMLLSLAGPSQARADARCDARLPAVLDGTTRSTASADGEALSLDLPAAGLVALDLQTSTTATAPRLRLLPCDDDPWSDVVGARVLKRAAHQLVLAVPQATRLALLVDAQDPVLPLGRYRLRAHFLDLDFARFGTLEQNGSDYDDGEDEPDPSVLGAGRYDWTPGLSAWQPTLCDDAVIDDHGDALLCATMMAVDQPVTASIANGWGDDDDFFAFTIERMQTLVVAAVTDDDVNLIGSLYDRHGERLATPVSDAEGGFRLVRTLRPGVYFVRVEGRGGSEGDYTIGIGDPR